MNKILIFKMKWRIWKFLSQILSFRNDLADVIRPFMENLNNNNLNDENFNPLQTFSKFELEVLCKTAILSPKKVIFKASNNKNSSNEEKILEKIIEGDKIHDLEELLQKIDLYKFTSFLRPFNEVKQIKIPILQYCIMNNAIKCFKFILVNGFDDPNKLMEEQNPEKY